MTKSRLEKELHELKKEMRLIKKSYASQINNLQKTCCASHTSQNGKVVSNRDLHTPEDDNLMLKTTQIVDGTVRRLPRVTFTGVGAGSQLVIHFVKDAQCGVAAQRNSRPVCQSTRCSPL